MLSKELLDVIVCPKCKGPVKYSKDKLTCSKCRLKYKINNDIPDMLTEDAEKF